MMVWCAAQPVDHSELCRFVSGQRQMAFVASVDGLETVTYRHCLLDMNRWDAYWRRDRCNYVPADLQEFPQECCLDKTAHAAEVALHQLKIDRWARHVQQTPRFPAVCFEVDLTADGQLRIRQGRHRLAFLRGFGLPQFVAAIPLQRIAQFEALGLLVDKL